MDDLPAPAEGGFTPVEKEEVPQLQVPGGEKEASILPFEHREQQPPKEPAKESPDLSREAAAEGAQLAGQLGRPPEAEGVNRPQTPVQQLGVEERSAVSQFTHVAMQEGFSRQVARSRLRQLEAQGRG